VRIRLVFIGCLLTTLLSPAVAQLSGVKICIDPGHGGFESDDRHIIPDPGVDFWESESNFRKALHLKALLETRGAIVLLTRNTNSDPGDVGDPSLSARVALANSNNVDWFHSIHSNATGLPLGQNVSTNNTLMLVREQIVEGGDPIYGPGTGSPEWPQAWEMSANHMGPNIRVQNRTTDNRTRLDWTFYGGSNGGYTLGVLRGLLMPGELSEGSFHDFYPETRRLMNNDYRKGEAYALTRSFQRYFGTPADAVGIVCGIVMDGETGRPKNGVIVRLLPENRVYSGDNYYNGFFLFDSLSPGPRWLRFENPGYVPDSVLITIAADSTVFADRTLASYIAPYVANSSPKSTDTAFSVKSVLGVQFSRAMDTASVHRAFHLSPSAPGYFYWGNDRTIYYDPIDWLEYSTIYVLTIDSTATSVGGVALDAANVGSPNSFSIQFRTASAPTNVESAWQATPTTFVLYQNFPNPFNPATEIRYALPTASHVRLTITDFLGREVARLVDEVRTAGFHNASFNAAALPSGFYFARLTAGSFHNTVKMVLLK